MEKQASIPKVAKITLLVSMLVMVAVLLENVSTVAAETIWEPRPGLLWTIQLTNGPLVSYPVQAYDLDLFGVSNTTIAQLHALGIQVICYFSAGTYQPWESDAAYFPPEFIGEFNGYDYWLSINEYNVTGSTGYSIGEIMSNRLQYASKLDCDGIHLDMLTAYEDGVASVISRNASGLTLGPAITQAQQESYNFFLADQTHSNMMAAGIANGPSLVKEMAPKFDFAITEACLQAGTCTEFEPYIEQDKAVLAISFNSSAASVCSNPALANYSTIIKPDGTLDGNTIICGLDNSSSDSNSTSNSTLISPQCGDNVCSATESNVSCAKDCAPHGNGNETSSSGSDTKTSGSGAPLPNTNTGTGIGASTGGSTTPPTSTSPSGSQSSPSSSQSTTLPPKTTSSAPMPLLLSASFLVAVMSWLVVIVC